MYKVAVIQVYVASYSQSLEAAISVTAYYLLLLGVLSSFIDQLTAAALPVLLYSRRCFHMLRRNFINLNVTLADLKHWLRIVKHFIVSL